MKIGKPHPKKCWCAQCRPTKVEAFKQSYLEKVRLMVVPKPRPTPDALIPVRAHFRRQKGYMRKLKDLVPWARDIADQKAEEIK